MGTALGTPLWKCQPAAQQQHAGHCHGGIEAWGGWGGHSKHAAWALVPRPAAERGKVGKGARDDESRDLPVWAGMGAGTLPPPGPQWGLVETPGGTEEANREGGSGLLVA